jgi:hypothetical protein
MLLDAGFVAAGADRGDGVIMAALGTLRHKQGHKMVTVGKKP